MKLSAKAKKLNDLKYQRRRLKEKIVAQEKELKLQLKKEGKSK